LLKQKKIIIGITGGIAAYKCAMLVRLLVKSGAEVKVVMTKAAMEFITPQTLSVLSKNKVYSEFFDPDLTWNSHVDLAEWADLMIIAPLTANSLAKMASGQCDNILLATYFSLRTPVFLAPAMDLEMYKHPTVLRNLQAVAHSGNQIIPAESGELASGLIGEGRMAEPETILKFIEDVIGKKLPLSGKKALVNAGPTYEPIDRVRFIGNRSSGKMGAAIAEILADHGAEVTLVMGPSSVALNHKKIRVISVETNKEMYQEMLKYYSNRDIVVCSAAVSDYTPEYTIPRKIKKDKPELSVKLIKTIDILQELGLIKQNQFLVGFALETENLIENATEKLKRKNCDLIVANLTEADNSAFNSDFNKVVFVSPNNKPQDLGFKSKREIASDLVQLIIQKLTLK
jgi:phosphopantothenoylcysteine decarboxylase/phosphopantothenate--cysteine ligase